MSSGSTSARAPSLPLAALLSPNFWHFRHVWGGVDEHLTGSRTCNLKLRNLSFSQFANTFLPTSPWLGKDPLTACQLDTGVQDCLESCVLNCQREVFRATFCKHSGLNLGRPFCVCVCVSPWLRRLICTPQCIEKREHFFLTWFNCPSETWGIGI